MRYFLAIIALVLAGPALALSIFAPGMPANPAIIRQSQATQQASACYNIGDADARAYCLARAHRDASRCYNIQRADLRAMCKAEATR